MQRSGGAHHGRTVDSGSAVYGLPAVFRKSAEHTELPDPNLRIEGGILKDWNETPPSVTLVIPAGVTEIADDVFKNCTGLTQVNFPASLTKIGKFAFYGCTGLTGLTLPASLEKLDTYAFSGCTEITGTVAIPANLRYISWNAFSNCNKIDAFDFTHCTQLTFIGSEAFENCTKITAMNLPANLETLDASAFSGCTNLTTLTVDAANTHLSSQDNIIYNFNKTKLLCRAPNVTQVTFPATLTEIADDAFYHCTSLGGTVILPASLKTIGNTAFYNCNKVDAFDFSQCTQLTSINNNAFGSCTKITAMNLPASLETISGGAFSGCTALATLTVDAASTHLSS